jgi:hypothetical protein
MPPLTATTLGDDGALIAAATLAALPVPAGTAFAGPEPVEAPIPTARVRYKTPRPTLPPGSIAAYIFAA